MTPGICSRSLAVLAMLGAGVTGASRLFDAAQGNPELSVAPRAVLQDSEDRSGGLVVTDFTFAPGTAVPRHRHSGFLFVYVLAGTVRSQLGDGRLMKYSAGQSWVEPPGAEQTSIDNPDPAQSAHLLVIFIAPVEANATL